MAGPVGHGRKALPAPGVAQSLAEFDALGAVMEARLNDGIPRVATGLNIRRHGNSGRSTKRGSNPRLAMSRAEIRNAGHSGRESRRLAIEPRRNLTMSLPDGISRCEQCREPRWDASLVRCVDCADCADDPYMRKARYCKDDCAQQCASCDGYLCDFHAARECRSCRGPSDAEARSLSLPIGQADGMPL